MLLSVDLGSGQAQEDRKLGDGSSLKHRRSEDTSTQSTRLPSSSPVQGGVHGAQPLQHAVRVTWLQVGAQEGGAGQGGQGPPADLRSVLGPLVARQEGLQRGSAPWRQERRGGGCRWNRSGGGASPGWCDSSRSTFIWSRWRRPARSRWWPRPPGDMLPSDRSADTTETDGGRQQAARRQKTLMSSHQICCCCSGG